MEICIHCDEVAVPPIYNDDDSKRVNPFCCQGCQTVHNILHQKGLESYYEIKNNSAIFKRRSPVEVKSAHFKFLDDPEFIREFSYTESQGLRSMELSGRDSLSGLPLAH